VHVAHPVAALGELALIDDVDAGGPLLPDDLPDCAPQLGFGDGGVPPHVHGRWECADVRRQDAGVTSSHGSRIRSGTIGRKRGGERRVRFFLFSLIVGWVSVATAADTALLLKPARVFDGTTLHAGWRVLVQGDRIAAVG